MHGTRSVAIPSWLPLPFAPWTMERLDLNSAVRANEGSLRKILESLRDIP